MFNTMIGPVNGDKVPVLIRDWQAGFALRFKPARAQLLVHSPVIDSFAVAGAKPVMHCHCYADHSVG